MTVPLAALLFLGLIAFLLAVTVLKNIIALFFSFATVAILAYVIWFYVLPNL